MEFRDIASLLTALISSSSAVLVALILNRRSAGKEEFTRIRERVAVLEREVATCHDERDSMERKYHELIVEVHLARNPHLKKKEQD